MNAKKKRLSAGALARNSRRRTMQVNIASLVLIIANFQSKCKSFHNNFKVNFYGE